MEHIAALRKRAGLTQSELGMKIGIEQGSVAKLEKLGCYPTADKLPAIADALECSIDALFGRSPPSQIPSYPRKEV